MEDQQSLRTPAATSYLPDDLRRATWVIVAGGIDEYGAMDKANFAVARHLVTSDRLVHLVAHRVADELRHAANVRIHLAPTPAGSLLLGEMHLSRVGRHVASRLRSEGTPPIVLSNGGNCAWPGVNWVHSLHHAWPTAHQGAPVAFRLKNTITKASAKYREARALRLARLIVANSNRTEQEIIKWMPETADRVQTIYLGSDPSFREGSSAARDKTRRRLGVADDIPVVLFAGALSHDNNKGLDVLVDAWRVLSNDERWDAKLLVAGGGRAVEAWRHLVAADPALAGSVSVLGHVSEMNDLYAASDLLVAPSRYEAYGLAAHEAICAGVPVLISGTAGMSERYPADLAPMILRNPTDGAGLAGALRSWRTNAALWPQRFAPLRRELLRHSWDDMAQQIVRLAESRLAPHARVAR